MQFGVVAPSTDRFGDPREAARLARSAEDAGWDGYFVWDALGFLWDNPTPSFDPWVILSAAAMATERIRLGTCVAVFPRYQPHLLAVASTSLDILSGGRLILGVGLGAYPAEFSVFGEPSDALTRAEKMDEGLDIVSRLWSGEEVAHRGKHYTVGDVKLAPTPIQQPRIPVWVGGESHPAQRRAARWDGWIGPGNVFGDWTPDDAYAIRQRIEQQRLSGSLPEIAWAGFSTPGDRGHVASFGEAGATWWIEVIDPWNRDFDENLGRITQGPAR